jgi:hypothetical protein
MKNRGANIVNKISKRHLKFYEKRVILPEVRSTLKRKIYTLSFLVYNRPTLSRYIPLIFQKRWLWWLQRCFTTIFGGYKGGYKGGYRWVTHPKPTQNPKHIIIKKTQLRIYIPL